MTDPTQGNLQTTQRPDETPAEGLRHRRTTRSPRAIGGNMTDPHTPILSVLALRAIVRHPRRGHRSRRLRRAPRATPLHVTAEIGAPDAVPRRSVMEPP
jgi:hypothetical protein